MDQLEAPLLERAQQFLHDPPVTVTAERCPRSAGGIHDFYSEGDYWWPDTAHPEGPYVRRDGMSNPGNFSAHREALMRFSELVGTFTSAFLLTRDTQYAEAALAHCQAWFMTDSTRMNPNLLYAQAIKGRYTGRGIGIIDAIHFMDVVQSIRVLSREGMVDAEQQAAYKAWVSAFLHWLTTHPYGLKEMIHPNNHGSWWNAQVGLYAVYVENDSMIDACRSRFTDDLLPRQMADNGSFPLELERTKPYAYSLFNLDAFALNCWVLSDATHDLWTYTSADGKSMRLGLDYMAPYLADKSQWPHPADVMYPDEWPVAQPAFLLGAIELDRSDLYDLWAPFALFPEIFELRRAQPIHSPLIYIL